MLKMARKRLLITGANGLLGNKAVVLASRNYEVMPLHHVKPLHDNSLEVDIADKEQVLSIFRELWPDAVIHAAAETNVDRCETQKEHAWNVNVEGTRNVAEACEKIGAKLVYISTDYVFDGEKGNYKEGDRPNPINYYAVTKLEGEKQVIQNCKNLAILRTSVLYGWHPLKRNFATWVINELEQNKEITVVEDHYNTPTLADNLAEMAIEAIPKDLQGVYHACGSERIGRYEFARQIARAFDLNQNLIRPIKMEQLTAWIAKRPRDSSLNTDKIRSQLEAKPLNITEGLDRMKKEAET
jgi:dTDP-4-dehydrorhamnose reductase